MGYDEGNWSDEIQQPPPQPAPPTELWRVGISFPATQISGFGTEIWSNDDVIATSLGPTSAHSESIAARIVAAVNAVNEMPAQVVALAGFLRTYPMAAPGLAIATIRAKDHQIQQLQSQLATKNKSDLCGKHLKSGVPEELQYACPACLLEDSNQLATHEELVEWARKQTKSLRFISESAHGRELTAILHKIEEAK